MPTVESSSQLSLSERGTHITPFHFEQGIPGFEQLKDYVIEQPMEDFPFYELQAVADERVRFWITNPFLFEKEYHFELNDAILEDLDIQSEQDVVVFAIVTVKESWEQATINLAAPLIVNASNRKCRQYILSDSPYATKHPLFPAEKTNSTAADKRSSERCREV